MANVLKDNMFDERFIEKLVNEIIDLKQNNIAIALDFDGVCKLFTQFKHQIMFTCMFIHLSEFQRVPFNILRDAYNYINFESADYAGKERFVCVNGLAKYLSEKGYDCLLRDLDIIIDDLNFQGLKISENNLIHYQNKSDIARVITWSREVNQKIACLSQIGLTPGIEDQILKPFMGQTDFYVVSTAPESSIKSSMDQEEIECILRYFGQETASKAQVLFSLCRSGYDAVFMFGDSVEDSRAYQMAQKLYSGNCRLIFIPVIPGQEEKSFSTGKQIIEHLIKNNYEASIKLSEDLIGEFDGKEAGKTPA